MVYSSPHECLLPSDSSLVLSSPGCQGNALPLSWFQAHLSRCCLVFSERLALLLICGMKLKVKLGFHLKTFLDSFRLIKIHLRHGACRLTSVIPTLKRQSLENHHKFKVILVYTAKYSRPESYILKPSSKQEQTKEPRHGSSHVHFQHLVGGDIEN